MTNRWFWPLALVAALEAGVITYLMVARPSSDGRTSIESVLAVESSRVETAPDIALIESKLREAETRIGVLSKTNALLLEQLADAKTGTSGSRAEVAFSYGSPAEAGLFVGNTFRRLFEAATVGEVNEAQDRLKAVEIDILSLGPFIQEAEAFESDPTVFSAFQAALVGEVLQLGTERESQLQGMLIDLKTRASQFPTGSDAWNAINQEATHGIVELLSESERSQMEEQIKFFSKYGALIIPTYSILD